MIFYFTATGNSLCAARMFGDDKLISIPQAMRGHMHFKAENIGIVCPIYGSEPPYMVRDFLHNASFYTDYFYIVMTYGRSPGVASEIMRSIVTECGLKLDYFRTVRMADNYLPAFDMDKEKQHDTKFNKNIVKIVQEVEAKKHFIEQVKLKDRLIYQGYLAFTKAQPDKCWKNITYTVDENCTGCGLCQKVCPVGCVTIEKGKAVNKRQGCQVCLACIQLCPHKAVHMSVAEVNPNARFINSSVTIADIIAANNTKR